MSQIDFSAIDKILFAKGADAPASSAPNGNGNGSVDAFVAQVAPAARRIGQRLGVDPAVLIGQWGLETGWGKSVIPGTNNLGNIKDFSGQGAAATDNMTGSRDKYRQYASADAFADDFAGLLERRYSDAIGAGSDALRFGQALKAGGYAEDPDYAAKLARAAGMVRGSALPAAAGAAPAREPGRYGLPFERIEGDVLDAAETQRATEARQARSDASPTGTNLARGWEQMGNAVGNYFSLLAGDDAAIAERMQNWEKYDRENPQPTATRKFMEDWQDEHYLSALTNPSGFAGGMTEQLANSLPSMIGSIPGMLVGASAGAPLGPLGILIGAGTGAAVGSAPGSVAVETGARLPAMMAADGIDISDAAAVNGWLRQNRGRVLSEGAAKGLTVAAFDGAAGGMGSAIVMRPALRFAQAEARIAQRFGVNPADARALAAVRNTPAYRAAIAPFKAELDVASTAAKNAMRGFASFAAETAGEIGGEYFGETVATGEGNWNEALLEGVMAGGQSAATTGAQMLGKGIAAKVQPNSPLTNAANAAKASAPAAAGVTPGASSRLQAALLAQQERGVDEELAASEARTQQLAAEQAAAQQAERERLAAERALQSEAAAAFDGADDEVVQATGADDQEGILEWNRFLAEETADRDARIRATQDDRARLQAEQEAAQREAVRAERPRNQVGDPSGSFGQMNEFAQFVADERADLDVLHAAIAQARRDHDEAAEARLLEIQQAIEGNRAIASAQKRRAVLDTVLADPETANPLERFAAELNRQGFRDSLPTADERATIARFEDVRAGVPPVFASPAGPSDSARSAVSPVKPVKQSKAVTPDLIRQAVSEGYALQGGRLTKEGAEPIVLAGPPHVAAAREALARRNAKPALTPLAQSLRGPLDLRALPDTPSLEDRVQAVIARYEAIEKDDFADVIRAALRSDPKLTEKRVAFWEEHQQRMIRQWNAIAGAEAGTNPPVEPQLYSAEDLNYSDHSGRALKGAPAAVLEAVLAKLNDNVRNLARLGLHLSDIDARFPSGVQALKDFDSALRGQFSRYVNQLMSIDRGYKRANPETFDAAEATLSKDLGIDVRALRLGEAARPELTEQDQAANGTQASQAQQAKTQGSQPAAAAGVSNDDVQSEEGNPADAQAGRAPALRAAEGQGSAGPRLAGPWQRTDLIDEDGDITPHVVDAFDYMRARASGNTLLTSAISASLADRDASLGLTFPGMERAPLPASLSIRFTEDEAVSEDLDPSDFPGQFTVAFGNDTVAVTAVEIEADDTLYGVSPLVLDVTRDNALRDTMLLGYRVEGVEGVFDFLDAIDQANAQLAERAARSPKKQQIDAVIAEHLGDAPEPTAAQKAAENYKVAPISLLGLEISIESPKGSTRSGTAEDGETWSVTMPADYGRIKGTIGADKDHVDIFVGPKPEAGQFWIINQNKFRSSNFDEHKVMVGFDSESDAVAAYLLSFSDHFGADVFGSVSGPFTADEFKEILGSGALEMKRPVNPRVKSFMVQQDGTAPEHANNQGKPLDPSYKFIPFADGPVTMFAPVDESIVPLHIDAEAFKEVTDEFAALFAEPDAYVQTEKRVKPADVLAAPDLVRVNETTWELRPSDETRALIAKFGWSKADEPRILITEAREIDKDGEGDEVAYSVTSNYTNRYDTTTIKYKALMVGEKREWNETRDAGTFRSNKAKKRTPAMVFDSARKEAQALWLELETSLRTHDDWTDRAIDQAEDGELRSENADRVILSLFDLSGEWAQPWADAGYTVIPIDIQDGMDVLQLTPETLFEELGLGSEVDVYGILAATPCTDFASAGAKFFADKDADGRTEASKELVMHTLALIEGLRPSGFWVLENPVGRIESLTGLPPARMSFDPWQFGHAYTKKTMLWGNFNAELPLSPVEPVLGSKMWSKYGGKSQATKNARSVTPRGFAKAFFMANNYADMPAEYKLTHEYPEASGAIKQALKAGIPEARIHELMEDTYGNFEYEEARNALIREVAAVTGGPEGGKPKGGLSVFVSGLSRPGDFGKAMDAGKPFGVEVGELSAPSVGKIGRHLGEHGGTVFIDSGAFSVFTANLRNKERKGQFVEQFSLEEFGYEGSANTLDFDGILARYEDIVGKVMQGAEDAGHDNFEDPDHAKLYLVMPDIVGSQDDSVALVARYAQTIRDWQGYRSVRPIVPIQRGDATLTEAFDAIAKLVGDDGFVVGIPSNEEAIPNDELAKFVAERGDRIQGIHILGAAAQSRLDPKVEVIRAAGGEHIDITADAFSLRSHMYGGTPRAEALRKALDGAGPRATAAPAAPEPKGWRKSYGAAQKYAEALGVELRGGDGKFLKLPELVAAIEAKQAPKWEDATPPQRQQMLDAAMTKLAEDDRQEREASEEQAVLAKDGDVLFDAYGENGWQVIGDVKDADDDSATLRVRVNLGYLSERQKSVSLREFKQRLAEDRTFRAKHGPKAPDEPTPDSRFVERSYGGVNAFFLRSDLDGDARQVRMYTREGRPRQGYAKRELIEPAVPASAPIDAQASEQAATPLYPAGHEFIGDGGVHWTITDPVMPGDKVAYITARKPDGTPANYAPMYSLGYIESEMKIGREWQAEQERERAKAPAAPVVQTVEPESLEEMRAALEAGYRVHFDYAGTDGRTLWVERTEKGHVIKSKDDDSSATITKGGDPRGGGFSLNEAVRRALQDAEYRFTQWKPLAEQQGEVDQILTGKVKALTDWGVEQSQIEQAVAEYKAGDATLIDDLLRISAPEPEQTSDASDDVDLDAMFDEILAEEMVARTKPKRDPRPKKMALATPEQERERFEVIREIEYLENRYRPKTADEKRRQERALKVLQKRLKKLPAGMYAERAIRAWATTNFEAFERVASMNKEMLDEAIAEQRDVDAVVAWFDRAIGGFDKHLSYSREYVAFKVQELAAADKPKREAKPKAEGTPKKPRSAGKAAASAVKNTAAGFADAIAGLGKLFGGHGRLSSGLTFDEETYAKAQPLFKQAIAHFGDAAADVGDVMRAVVRAVLDQFGSHVAANMKPYIIRFSDDVRKGKIDYDESVEVEGENHERDVVRDESSPSLGAVATEEDGGPEGRGGVRGGDAGGRTRGRRSGAGSDGERVSDARGGRSGAEGADSADAGARGDDGGLGGRGTGGDGSGVSEGVRGLANVPSVNFTITEDVRLGQGGEEQKFQDNLAAIRVLKEIEHDRRRATPDEQRALARYVGWGGLKNAFAETNGVFKEGWADKGQALADLLLPLELAAARNSTQAAHYTSQTVVNAMWAAAQRLGFTGGSVLEPSVGTGNFIGLMPEGLRGQTRVLAIEKDSVTARIAKALYPQSTVLHSPMEKVPLPDNSVDLAIGNPPFGRLSLTFGMKPELRGVSIHNQFFRASMDAVRPGGLQIMVVSRFLMDAQRSDSRRALAEKAELLGAIRLPDSAFRENARTDVVTDILFLRRRSPADEARMSLAFVESMTKEPKNLKADEKAERAERAALIPSWVEIGQVPDPLGSEPIAVNRYFIDNPNMILGTLERSGGMQFDVDEDGNKVKGVNVKLRDGRKLPDLLTEAIQRLPENVAALPHDAIQASLERFESMAEALEIALSGREAGDVVFNDDGQLSQVIEREVAENAFELALRPITPASPWASSLIPLLDGSWYRNVPKLDDKGRPVKVMKDGKPTNRNAYEREIFPNDAAVPVGLRLGEAKFERLQKLVRLRDALKRQLVLESQNVPTEQMDENRAELAGLYRRFVAEHGHINDKKNADVIGDMPDGALVLALEMSYRPAVDAKQAAKTGKKQRSASAEPAAILSERVVVPYAPPGRAESAQDALAINLAETGRVDLARLGALLDTDEAGVIEQLHDSLDEPLLFRDPETKTWETRDAYLSGNVRRKLQAARDANLDKNIAALTAVQPQPWGAENVTVRIGAAWVPTDTYAEFLTSLVGGKAVVRFSRLTNAYAVNSTAKGAKVTNDWGTADMPAPELFAKLLNSSPVKIMRTDSEGHSYVDQEATALALIKAKEMSNAFADWVFADSDRRQALVALFNDKFNTRVARQHDGSHLTLPGKVPDAVIKMRRHQKNAIWRGVVERFLLIDHAVGAGKTFTAIARAMERRRMGLSKKPMIVVPNHMVQQFTVDVYRLYPGAKVLAASAADFTTKNRRKLFAKMATGDWDIVIAPHSSFGFIGIAPETEERFLLAELNLAEQAVKDAESEAADLGIDSGWRKPFNVAQAEAMRDKLQAQLDKLRTRPRDKLLTFEQMGVDDLTIDEFHEFKNLFYHSRLVNVRGMGSRSGSQKAFDVYNKVRVLREQGGSVVAMTGTPISNSAVEMYNLMRVLAYDDLIEMGLEHFDAWRAQFVEAITKYEPDEAGRLKEVNRLGRGWSNMRNLMELYYGFTDAVGNEDIQRQYAADNDGKPFPIPNVKGGGRQSVVVPPTAAQQALLTDILAGFEGLENIQDIQERNATRLRLMDRARKVSLDARAVDPHIDSDEAGGKLDQIANETTRIYRQWDAEKGTQLIFLDRSVPKSKGDDKIVKEYDKLRAEQEAALEEGDEEAYRRKTEALEKFDENEIAELRNALAGGWNAYAELKRKLMARGIPADQIRFVQEATDDAQKQALFDAVNAGEVRVLIGSTPRMGAGTNVQQRLVGLHHADVTWKPSDIEQREGRIIRQGNRIGFDEDGNVIRPGFEVEILAYATERTVDAKMWDLNATKLKMINGIRKYVGDFNMDFPDDDAVGMAEMAALASGDPMLLERVQLMAEIDTIELLERAHRRKEYGMRDAIASAERTLRDYPERIEQIRADAAAMTAAFAARRAEWAQRSVTVEGQASASRFDAMKTATEAIKAQRGDKENARFAIMIDGKRITSQAAVEEAVANALGDETPFRAEINGETFIRRSQAVASIIAKAVPLAEKLQKGESDSAVLGTLLGAQLEVDVARLLDGSYDLSLSLISADGRTLDSAGLRDRAKTHEYSPQALRGVLANLEERAEATARATGGWMEDALASARRDLPELQARVGQPFAQAAELEVKRGRLKEVTLALAGNGTKVVGDGEGGAADQTYIPPGARFRREGAKVLLVRTAVDYPIPELPDLQFFTVNNKRDKLGAWQVVEAGTGITLARAPKREGLAKAVAENLARLGGADGVRRAVEQKTPITDAEKLAALYPPKAAEASDGDAPSVQRAPRANDGGAKGVVSRVAAERLIGDFLATRPGVAEIVLVDRFAELPADVQEDARNQQAGASTTQGSFKRGKVYLVLENHRSLADLEATLFHEALGHAGVRRMLGAQFVANLNQLFVGLGGIGGLSNIMHRRGMHGQLLDYIRGARAAQVKDPAAWTDALVQMVLTEEVFAHIAEQQKSRPSLMDRFKALIGALRAWSRRHGLLRFAELGETDVLHLLARARSSLHRPDGGGPGGGVIPGVLRSTDNWVDSPSRLLPEGVRAAPERAVNALADALPKKVGDYLRYVFGGDTSRTFNWFHKTVGSQAHKAKVDPEHYGRVFELAQSFIEDVSRVGTKSADQAPDLLPKMDTLAVAAREAWNYRKDGADAKAIAAPIFDGTLYEENGQIVGKVWSRDELRSLYNLNERQIELYRQFRAAVDHSLEALAVAEMTKVAKAYSEPKQPGDIVLLPPSAALGMNDLAKHYSEQFAPLLKDARQRLLEAKQRIVKDRELLAQNAISVNAGRVEYHKMMLQKEAEDNALIEALEKDVQELVDLRQAFDGKAATIRNLQQAGYAPLMRFGKYTVDVVEMVPARDDDGNEIVDSATGEMRMVEQRNYFGMYESEVEARQDADLMREMYPKATVTTGIGSQDGYQLFGAVSMDSLESLAKLAGMEENAFVQKFYKEATAQRSALKRLIHRKGIKGYSQDVTRSLSAFILSNARATASAYHFGDLMNAALAIPKEKGDVKDEAVRLINYIRDPNEEAGALRGILFMHYLGGSIASAAVNLTQTLTTTAPFLHQYGVGAADLVRAGKMATRRMGGKDLPGISAALESALARAEDEGVVAPHNIHALMGQSGATSFTNHRMFRLFSHMWGSFFGMAEQFNRETAFIAAFEAAEKMGRTGLQEAYARAVDVARNRGLPAPDRSMYVDPYVFARNAVRETQFVLSKAARPNWARGAVGATLFTFRQFSINYLELFKRLPNKERAMMLAVLIVLAGVGGLPFADDLDDLIDTLGQSAGFSTNSERWRHELLRAAFGEHGGEFVERGVSAFLPLELSTRLGMGNILPATGVFKPSNAGRRDKEAMEILGAMGGYYNNLMDAADYLQRGRYAQAFTEAALPKALKDAAKGAEMAQTGVYDDTRGRRVVDTDGLDAFIKAIGFQPTAVSRVQRMKGLHMQDVGLFRAVKANIAEMLAQGQYENNPAKRQKARDLRDAWNRKNPDQYMDPPNPAAVAKRVNAMRMSANERMSKTAPKELRKAMLAEQEG